MALESITIVLVVPFHGRLLDFAIHPLAKPVHPWMSGLGEAMLNPVCGADHVKLCWP